MFNNLGFHVYRPVRRRVRPVRRAYPVIAQFGGSGTDFFINGGMGPPGPPGPPGVLSPVPTTEVTTPTYTPTATDYFLCVDHTTPVIITLPTGILGTVYVVKDCSGNAQTFPIAISGSGGQTVDGSFAIIDANYGSNTFVFNGTEWSIV